MTKRDDLYQRLKATSGSFRFDEQVTEVFEDMIDRSVPGYSLIVPMIGQLARRYVQAGSNVHDLGSSLGAVSLAIHHHLRGRKDSQGIRIIATDNAGAMVHALRKRVDALPADRGPNITVQEKDVRDVEFEQVSMAILNFTLQFLERDDRDQLMLRIAEGMMPGGALILAEKIEFPDPATASRQADWHHDYKRLQGYSELEISRKRSALEDVLLTETEARHVERLKKAGFRRVTRWFQCFGFHAWLAER